MFNVGFRVRVEVRHQPRTVEVTINWRSGGSTSPETVPASRPQAAVVILFT